MARGSQSGGKRRGGADSWIGDLALEHSALLTKRNRIELFFEGDEAFSKMLSDITRAEQSVHLEIYMFLSDAVGALIAEKLSERARAGVPVRVVYDAIGSIQAEEEMFAGMRAAGVEVRVFRPVAPWRKRSGILGRNHRKNLIIDGRVAYTGGMNIGEMWSRKCRGEGAWRDTHMRIEGAGAAACEDFFRRTWRKVGGEAFPVPVWTASDVMEPGGSACLVVGGSGFSRRKAIRRLYSRAFSHARRKIELTVPYFVPPQRMLASMKRAASRGVVVEVLVPRESDVRLADWLREGLCPALIDKGVSFFEYSLSILHAKSLVVDDELVILGSANFDFLSISLNWELAVVVMDPEVVKLVQEQYRRDLEGSGKVTAGSREYPWWHRLLGKVGAFLIRKL